MSFPVPAPGSCSQQGRPTRQRTAGSHRGASVGHGEDPSAREQTERTPERDTGEGENDDVLEFVCMF